MKSIEEIKMRGKVPIVVGGTNYYIEPLLYDMKMDSD
jgi:tRNA A37 N6-isopentenylltransferase MiaA